MGATLKLDLKTARDRYGEEVVARSLRHARWRTGDLGYHCSAVQKRARIMVYEHASRRKVWETNRRFGKSRTCVLISGEKCLAFPGVRVPYAAPTATQVRNFVHPHMLELGNHAPPELAPELVQGEWVFPPLQWFDAAGNPVATKLDGGTELARYKGTKSEELLRISRVAPHGCEDRKKANALRGTGTVYATIDEARDIPILRYVVGSVIGPMLWEARSRWHELAHPTLLIASTPADEDDHPFAAIAEQAQEHGAYFHASVYDCEHLSEQDIADAVEECGGEHTVQWQVEGLAKRVRDPELMALAEFTDECVREVQRPAHYWPCVIGDHGHGDMTVIALGYYDFQEDRYVIEDEVTAQRARSDEVSAEIEEKERELFGDHRIKRRRIDAPPQVRTDMGRPEWQAGDETQQWSPVSRSGQARQRGGRMRALANRVRVLCSRGQVLVHPRCKTIIAHAKGVRWNQTRDDFVRAKDPDTGEPLHHYDGAAALCYFVRDVDTSNPYPAIPEGVSHDDHFVPPRLLRKRTEERDVFYGVANDRRR